MGNTTLPHGNYDIDTLTSVILAAYPNTITSATYSTNTGKITLVGTASFTVYSTSTCYTLIGGNAGDDYTGTSITFPYPVNLLGIRYLNFKCLDLPVSNWVGGVGKSPTLLTVGVDIGQFVNQLYTNNTLAGESSLPYSFDLNSFHIQVTDENDNLVNFNGVPWVMSISVTSFKVMDFSRRAIFGELFTNNIQTHDVLDETDLPPINVEDHPILKNTIKETQVTK